MKEIAEKQILLELLKRTKKPQSSGNRPNTNTAGAVSAVNLKVDGRSF